MLNAEPGGAQAGLFSAVSSAFIIDVQSKLEPDPNDMTAAYMRILIHTMNNSLFPDADPNSTTWIGPPPEIVTVQSLLYASLATSLFAAFLAMLGKQWVNRYLRNRGGSTADKSRDRQRKLDGFEKWHFRLAIESLPVMLQFALLLLGCALSRYLWTISHTVAGVTIAVTLFGVTSYVFLSLAATLYYNCPYQTPPSILTRRVIKYITHSDAAFAHTLRSLIGFLPSTGNLRQIFTRLRSGIHGVLGGFCCTPAVAGGVAHIPLAAVVTSPTQIFGDISIDWEVCRSDVRCVSWVLDSTTDTDVIFSTVRFAADMIWYPEIARALAPHILADHFLDCLLDGRVIPGKSEHASSIGMALASVLSTHLTIEPGNQALRNLCMRIHNHVEWAPSLEPTFKLVTAILRFVAYIPTPSGDWPSICIGLRSSIPHHLPTTHQLWLSRIMLQTIWRWSFSQDPTIAPNSFVFESIGRTLRAGNDQILAIIKTNCFLTIAISLGLQVDIGDLYAPNNKCVILQIYFCEVRLWRISDALETAVDLFNQRLQISIREGKVAQHNLTLVLPTLTELDPFQVMDTGEFGFSWIDDVLNSSYPEGGRYQIASRIMALLGKYFYFTVPERVPYVQPTWMPPLLGFLSLCEKFYTTESPPYPGFVALRILASAPLLTEFDATILPVLTPILLPTHPLQSRSLALKLFGFTSRWLSQMDNVPDQDLDRFLQAVGDPFQSISDPPLQDGQPAFTANYEPMMAAVVLIGLASSDLWQNHLRHSNFTSCEKTVSTEEGKRTALKWMLDEATCSWLKFLHTPARITTATRRLEDLQCLNTAEVVIMWAWTVGVVDPADHDGWRSIGRDTLRLCQTNGVGCPMVLGRHITDTSMENMHTEYLVGHYEGAPCRVGSVRRSTPALSVSRRLSPRHFTDLRVSQACQLRRLYHLFGYDPTTQEGAVNVGEGEQAADVSPGPSVASVSFMDLACDYP